MSNASVNTDSGSRIEPCNRHERRVATAIRQEEMTGSIAGVEPLFGRVSEAAHLLRISRAKAYELVALGVIPSVKIGNSIRVPLQALRDLAERAVKGGQG
jgi:excisionase family DNA binding protein